MQLPDPPLASIELTGWRWLLRQGALLLVGTTAVITGLVATVWTNDMVALPMFAVASAAAMATLHGARRGLWIGLALLAAGIWGAVFSFLAREPTPPMTLTQLGSAAMFLLGPPMIALDPLLDRLERGHRRRERARAFPTARVVSR